MAQKETRPLIVWDSDDGYVTSVKAHIKWACSNVNMTRTLFERRKKVESRGEYKFVKIIRSEDVNIPSKYLRFRPVCGGDLTDTIDRMTNVYELKYPLTNKHLCCMGKLTPESQTKLCDPRWKFNSPECDTVAKKYCEQYPTDEVCGCMLDSKEYAKSKLVGPPECIDTRCAGNPKAYKTQSMLNRNCPNIVNCVIDKTTLENIENSNISGIEYQQNCGMTLEEAKALLEKQTTNTNTNTTTTLTNSIMNASVGLSLAGTLLILGGIYAIYKGDSSEE